MLKVEISYHLPTFLHSLQPSTTISKHLSLSLSPPTLPPLISVTNT